MKKISGKNKRIIIAIAILVGIIVYSVFFYNSKIYKEFEETENIEELIPYEEEIQNTEISETNEESYTDEEMIIIHITGAVKNWGVIELPANSRISDAIEKAGGTTEDTDLSKVNLAFVLEDGMKINIPSINQNENEEEVIENYISNDDGQNVVVSTSNKIQDINDVVNINTATQTELETLPGIGTSTALKIINYRNENGKFKDIEEIKNVSGIGESKFNNIKNFICI